MKRNSIKDQPVVGRPTKEELALLSEQAARVKRVQLEKNGLIILQALYGDIIDINEEVHKPYQPGGAVDITMQLQAQVDPVEDTLFVQPSKYGIHEVLEGCPDPNLGVTKSHLVRNEMRVYIAYVYDNRFHWLFADANQAVVLPMQDHYEPNTVPIYQLEDNIAVNFKDGKIPHSSLPQFSENGDKLDANGLPYTVPGELWEFDEDMNVIHSYDVVPKKFIELSDQRPPFLYVEPRYIAYAREMKVKQQQEKRKLLIGGAVCLAGITLAATQLLGIVDMTQWPGLNLIFGTTEEQKNENNQQQQVTNL